PSCTSSSGAPRALHSFPTRRSSDLQAGRPARHHGRDQPRPRGGVGDAGPAVGRGRVATPQDSTPVTLADRCRAIELLLLDVDGVDRKSTRLNSSHVAISYAVFCLKK